MTNPATASSPYLFLSYASADRVRALAIADVLEASGVSVWVDRHDIDGGTSWGSEIVEAIKGCAALVILCSEAAMASRNVKQEIQLAWRYERAYLPLLLQSVDFPEQVQYFLEGWQWVELLDRTQAEWQHDVLRALRRLGVEASTTPAVTERDAPAAPPVAAVSVFIPPAAPSEPAPLDRLAGRVFVGREHELVTLRAALGTALVGQGHLLLLAGDPGIGKTRLAEQLAEEARGRGVEVLWGRCWEGDGAPAFYPWVEALRAALRGRDPERVRSELRTGAAELAQLLPELQVTFPDLPAAAQFNPEQARFRLFEAVTGFLQAAAAQRPVLLILDDLHWADKPSLLLLQFLARHLGGARLLVLGTYRDTELDRTHPLADVLASLRREPLFQRVLLHGLTAAETEAFVAAAGQTELQATGKAFAAALYRETEGNPFFLQETLRHLVESGKLLHRDGRWTSTTPTIAELGIPEGVREVVGRRLSRLSSETNGLLAVAAVAGREFSGATMVQVAGADEDAVDAALTEAEAARIVAPVPGVPPDRYRFGHALLRETLYEEVPSRRRLRLHRQIGEALEALYARSIDAHLAELAYHFCHGAAGGESRRAFEYAVRAGDAAYSAFAYEDAIAHWQAALEQLNDGEGVLEAAGVLRRIADAYRGPLRRFLEAVKAFVAAAEQYEQAGLHAEAARMRARAGWALCYVGPTQDLAAAAVHVEAAERLLAEHPDDGVLAETSLSRCAIATHQLRTRDALEAIQQTLDIAARLGDERQYVHTWRYGWQLCAHGRLREGLASLRQGRDQAARLDDSYNYLMAGLWAGMHRQRLDPGELVNDARQQLAHPPRCLTSADCEALASMAVVNFYAAGELADARLMVQPQAAAAPTPPMRLFYEGDWARAVSAMSEAMARELAKNNLIVLYNMAHLLARAQRLLGREDEAMATLEAALAGLDQPFLVGEVELRSALAVMYARRQRLAEAEAHLERCRAIVANGEDWQGCFGRVAVAEGSCAAACGRRQEAAAAFKRALAAFRRYRFVWEEAETRVTWAETLLAERDRTAAIPQLEEAMAIYHRIGAAAAWIERVQALIAG